MIQEFKTSQNKMRWLISSVVNLLFATDVRFQISDFRSRQGLIDDWQWRLTSVPVSVGPDVERHFAQSQADKWQVTAVHPQPISRIACCFIQGVGCGIELDSNLISRTHLLWLLSPVILLLSNPTWVYLTVISRNNPPPPQTHVCCGWLLAALCALCQLYWLQPRTDRFAAWLSRSQNLDHTFGSYRRCCSMQWSTVHGHGMEVCTM